MIEELNTPTKFIEIDFNLPANKKELFEAEDQITKLRIELDLIYYENTINDNTHNYYFEEIVRVLDYVGSLSKPAFAVGQEIEDLYFLKFKHSPALAKRLWQEHYENIHRPYNLLKNRCYRMLYALDENYIKKFKHTPPNWKI